MLTIADKTEIIIYNSKLALKGLLYICINLQRKINPRKKKARKIQFENLMALAQKRLEKARSEYDKIGLTWAVELQKMEPQQQLFAKKTICDILFDGQISTLHRDSGTN